VYVTDQVGDLVIDERVISDVQFAFEQQVVKCNVIQVPVTCVKYYETSGFKRPKIPESAE
jgi:hypothetical protein